MSEKVEHTKLRKLAEAATPGPWAATLDENYSVVTGPDGAAIALPDYETGICLEEADAAFIAAANPKTVLALLAERDRLREVLKSFANAADVLDRWGISQEEWFSVNDSAQQPKIIFPAKIVRRAREALKDTNQ